MSLLLPQRWQKQPQGPVRIDWSHPLAKGLTGVWIFNTSLPANLVNNKRSIISNAPSLVTVGNAKGIKNDNGSTSTIALANRNELFDTENAIGSMFAGYSNFGSPSNGALMGAADSQISQSTTIWPYWSTATFDFGVRINGSSATNKNNQLHRLHVSGLSSGHDGLLRGYHNGGIAGEVTKASTINTPSDTFYALGTGSNSCITNTAVSFIATWKRSLSPAEAKSFSNDPYQFLIPFRSIDSILTVSVLNIAGDIDLPLPSIDLTLSAAFNLYGAIDLSVSQPDITASAQVFDADAITAAIELLAPAADLSVEALIGNNAEIHAQTPSVVVSGDALIGELVEIGLSAPSINATLSGGIFQLARPLLTAPAISMSGSAIGGLIANLSLDAPIASVSGEVVHGIIGSASIDISVPDIAIEVEPSLELEIGVELSGSAVHGAIASASLPIALNVAMSATVEQLNLLSLPVGVPVLEASAVTNGIGGAELPVSVNMSASAIIGQAVSIAIDIPSPDIDARFGFEARGALSLEMPAPRLEASVYVPKPDATFYNRWTR